MLLLFAIFSDNGPVFWKKGGDILSTNGVVYGPFDSHMLLEERNGVFDLTVDSITLQDEDTYECEIPTVGKAGFTITVNSKHPTKGPYSRTNYDIS